MKRVLIIEDNEDNSLLISALLSRGGYETEIASTGYAGLTMAIENLYDLIILDIQLPDINGDKVIQKIRAQETNNHIPVIAMTSYAMNGDREKLLALGCTGYIEKPIDPIHILEQINKILKDAL